MSREIGEGLVAATFPVPQSEIAVTFYGANGVGAAYVQLFKADGSRSGLIKIPNVTNGPYGFKSTNGGIVGIHIYNDDVGGLGIYEIKYGSGAPADNSVGGALAAAAIATSPSNLEHTLKYPSGFSYVKPWLDDVDRTKILHFFSGGGTTTIYESSTTYTQEHFSLTDTYRVNGYAADNPNDSYYAEIDFLTAWNTLVEKIIFTGGLYYGHETYKTKIYYQEADYTATTVGSYPQTYGQYTFTGTDIVYTKESWQTDNYISSHTVTCSTANIVKIRANSLKVRVAHSGFYPNLIFRFGYEAGGTLPSNNFH